ncbi:MAG: O-antigen ligase family protein [Candidatus Omnitrophica bacterium]|nr:O-antigen ligase family protein [Candidatus Omnitrophota bacterium]
MLKNKEQLIVIADNLIEFALLGAIFFLPIANAAIEVFVYLAFAFFIFKKALRWDFAFLKDISFLFLGVFLLFCALSLFNGGPLFSKCLKAFFAKWWKGFFLVMVAADCFQDKKRIKDALVVFLWSAGLVVVDVLAQRFLGFEFLRGKHLLRLSTHAIAVCGPFTHYNGLGSYLIVGIPLIASFALKKDKGWVHRGLFVLFGLLMILCLVLSLSRGAWVGFMAELVLILCLTGRVRTLAVFSSCFILLMSIIPVLRQRFLFMFQSGGDSERFAIWKGAWCMIKEHPFLGKGVGTFMSYFAQYTTGLGVAYAHNCYLQIWAECGIFALSGFLLFAGSMLYRGVKCFKRAQDYQLLGLMSALLGFCVHSFFDTQLYSLQLVTMFWIISGMILGYFSSPLTGEVRKG